MPVKRKLAAVVIADVVGYSRLMERDEAGTHARLHELREKLFDPKIAEHGGRLVSTSGDGMLVEFPSATAALRCAVEVQREMGARNLYLTPDERIELRVGINLGDIIIDGADIAGDGVNVAARLETLAEPGGICVASAVWEQVHEDLGVTFSDVGEQYVKNISKPIRVYRVALVRETASNALAAVPTIAGRVARTFAIHRAPITVGAIVISASIGVGIWQWTQHKKETQATITGSPPLGSVAVAPFAPATTEAEDARFANALTRDLTSRLGASLGASGRRMRVVPVRNDTLGAGGAIEPRALGPRLNVRYVLEGNVFRTGEGKVLHLQLIDAHADAQVWSERDVFQDTDVSSASSAKLQSVMVRVRAAIGESEARRIRVAPLAGLSAEELAFRANDVLTNDKSLSSKQEAQKLLDRALELDPNNVQALVIRTSVFEDLYGMDPHADRVRLARQMDQDSGRAVDLDSSNAAAWRARGAALMFLERWDAALDANANAMKLDPESQLYLVDRGNILIALGRPADALQLADRVLGAGDPAYVAYAELIACVSHLLLGQAGQAVSVCEKSATFNRDWNSQAFLVAAYAQDNNMTKATAAKDGLFRLLPEYTVAWARAADQPSHPEYAKLAEKYFYNSLLRAGVPEK